MAVKVFKTIQGAAGIPQVPQKIDVPTYPDRGVAYAKYSKTLLSGNQFKLTPQTVFDFNGAVISGAGTTTFTFTMPTKDPEQKYYFTSISISANLTNACRIGLERGTSTIYASMMPTGTTERNITFGVPIEVKEATVRVTVSVGCAAGDQIVLNIFGWFE